MLPPLQTAQTQTIGKTHHFSFASRTQQPIPEAGYGSPSQPSAGPPPRLTSKRPNMPGSDSTLHSSDFRSSMKSAPSPPRLNGLEWLMQTSTQSR